jgi:hypothetical protein
MAYIAAILIVILIHEMGHFMLMRLFNYSNVKIFILPLLGAFTSGHKQRVSQFQLVLIILGGPVPGIVVGSLLFYMNRTVHNETIMMLSNAFMIINLLNLLPFYPLDGGRFLETLFFRENHTIRLVFGILSMLALLVFFVIFFNPILLIIPALIAFELYNERKHQKIREYLTQEKINFRVDYANLPDRDYWLIRDCLLLSFPRKYAGHQPGRHEYSPLEPVVVNQVSAVLQTNLLPDLKPGGKLLFILLYLLLLAFPVGLILLYR